MYHGIVASRCTRRGLCPFSAFAIRKIGNGMDSEYVRSSLCWHPLQWRKTFETHHCTQENQLSVEL